MDEGDVETDENVMLLVRNGEPRHLAVLYHRYRLPLFGFFFRLTSDPHLSEDLVQDVFLRILKYRNSFRKEHSFRTWIYQIARNVTRDSWRKAQRAPSPPKQCDFHPPDIPDDQPGPASAAGHRQDLAALEASLIGLSQDSREVLVLSRFQNLKYEEVADILQCSVGAVKMRVFRAMAELRERFHTLIGKESL